MSSDAVTERELPSSAASKFADAVRELIREELGRPKRVEERARPNWRHVVWVAILVVNVLLLASQVPEAALKNTSFEFAFKLVGSIFGGVLLVYSSWVRERLMKLCEVRWFQAAESVLLAVLIFAHFATFAIKPVLPPGARLFIDDGEPPVHLRGRQFPFTLRTHTVKILPPEGQETLPGGEEIRGYQLTITPKDLLWGAYRGPAASWSPLYPVYVKCRFPGSAWELTDPAGRLPENLADSDFQTVPGTQLVAPETLRVPLRAEHLAETAWAPVGDYTIHERRADGSVCSDLSAKVEQKANSWDLKDQTCPGSQ